ncbi:ArsR/SmtB family transcription factor [Furfurilactobacillus siliginis]|nr:metalloregulator ArsR/SmtB family transcription factor [Furfurilactobacillus siliginis]GEK28560.1 transcriptional regulator [Furfurilactobacillus siliginis]
MSVEHGSDECKQLIRDNVDIDFFRTVFDPVRSELIVFLASNGEMTVGDIADNYPQNRSVISRHLDIMFRYNIVQRRKEGREVYYQINRDLIVSKFQQTSENMTALMNLK